jgi:WD40 repeat protein
VAWAWWPGYNTIASGGDDNVRDWHVRAETPLNVFTGHAGRVWCVTYAPNVRTLATAGADRTVRLWDPGPTQGVIRLGDQHVGPVRALALAPDSRTLATGHTGKEAVIRLWDIHTQRLRAELRGHRGEVSALAWSADGRLLASSSDDRTVRLWDVAARRERFVLRNLLAFDLAFTPDGRRLVCCATDRPPNYPSGVFWHELTHGRCVDVLRGRISALAYSPDSQTLVLGYTDRNGLLWRRPEGETREAANGSLGRIERMAFAPDGKSLATVGVGGMVKVWEAETGKERLNLFGHSGDVHAVAFSPDGKTLVTGGDDRTIRLWELLTGREVLRLSLHMGPVRGVAVTPDGKTLLTAGEDDGPGAIYLWRAADGPSLRREPRE